jgi:NitT/TauT family transport system permease protein
VTTTSADPAYGIFDRQVAAEERRVRGRTVLVLACQIATAVVLVGVWQLAASLGWANPVYVGSPALIATELWDNTRNGLFFREALPTLSAIVVSFLFAASAGIAAGVLLHEVDFLDKVLAPFIAAINGVPRIALAPVTIVWFGLGMASKVALAFSLVVFIVLVTTEAALRNVDSDLVRLCRSLGASKLKTLTSVKLPWALPGIFAGLRLGLLYAIVSVIVNEMIASPDGLGQLIALYSNTFQISRMFAVLVFTSIATILADAGLQRIERRLRIW